VIPFLLKKTFYDLWDNLFRIMALNLGFWLSLSAAFVLPPLAVRLAAAGVGGAAVAETGGAAGLGLALFFILLYWLCVYLCAAAAAVQNASEYRGMTLGDFAAHLKNAAVPGGILFAAGTLICVLSGGALRYLVYGSLTLRAAAFFSCWLCLGILGIIQFYPAAFSRSGGGSSPKRKPLGTLKECAAFFFDNPGFCLFSLFFTLALSALILPCPCWSLLFLDEGFRLRMLKYRLPREETGQLRDGPEQNRKGRINWEAILAEEKEKTGARTWRDFLFPWKE
jgi:hypothetical protein